MFNFFWVEWFLAYPTFYYLNQGSYTHTDCFSEKANEYNFP